MRELQVSGRVGWRVSAILPALLLTLSPVVAGAAVSTADLPLVLEPGLQQRGEQPETWTLDLDAVSPDETPGLAEGLSARLYGSGNGDLHEPMVIRTGFDRDTVLGIHVTAASRSGARFDIEVDGEFFHRLSWPSAGSTHEVATIYHFPVPAGQREVRLSMVNPSGVVVIGGYHFAGSVDEFPEEVDREALEQDTRPVAGARDDGYRGIWFTLGQFSEYGDKYSGGLGTYTAKHIPLAVYAEEVDKTFFVYGGTIREDRYLLIMASYYDHANHRVPRPTVVHDKQGVDDPHDNPSISMDEDGHIWVFVSGRGRGRPGFKYRSAEPYSVDEFELIREQEMTYPQSWWIEGEGFIHLFTKYTRGRELYWETSPDGVEWSEHRKLAGMRGHYQSSYHLDNKVATFFNRHPDGSVDRRTDLYYAQTEDMGETWTTVEGEVLEVPLEEIDNPARVIDYESQGRLMYVVDINFDKDGNPILLYVTSGGHQPGPANEPRFWEILHWDGEEWKNHVVTRSDHNYDQGVLKVYGDRWVIIGPTGVGPQQWQTGGEVEKWESFDQGARWEKVRSITWNSERNHKYVRRPVNAADPFYFYWADGNPHEVSKSHLYFGESSGDRYWKLPYDMEDDYAEPVEMGGCKEGH